MARNKFMSIALVGVMLVGAVLMCTQTGKRTKHMKVARANVLDARNVTAEQIGGNVPQLDYDVHRAYVMIVVPENYESDPLSKEVIQVFGSDPDIRTKSITKIHIANADFRYRWGDSFTEAYAGAPTIAVMEENGTQARSVYKMPMTAKTDLKSERDRVKARLKDLAVTNTQLAYNDSAKSNYYDEDAKSEGLFRNRGGGSSGPCVQMDACVQVERGPCIDCLKRKEQPKQPAPAVTTNVPPALPPIQNTPPYEEEETSGEVNTVAVVLALGVAALVVQGIAFGMRKPG